MIDPWRRLPNWNKPFNVTDEQFDAVYRHALAATETHSAVRRILRGTTAEVIHHIPDGSLDFAYVDGDHTLRGITLDMLLLWPKVRDGGAIGGDDFSQTAWQHGPDYEPTMVSPWVVYFAEAMRAPLTILPGNQFLLRKSSDGFAVENLSGGDRDYSVTAHLGPAAKRPAVSRPPALQRLKRHVVGTMRSASPRFREYDSSRRFGPFPSEIKDTGYLFIHVPKAAGSSFSLALYGHSFGHHTLAEWQRNYPLSTAGLRAIAIIRDPVDRFISAFTYLKKGGMNAADTEYSRAVIGECVNPSEFAAALLTPAIQKKALTTGFHFRPQVEFVRDRSGSIAVDCLIPFERLDDAATRMADILGRPFHLPHVNKTDREDGNVTAEARSIIERLYAADGAMHRETLERYPSGFDRLRPAQKRSARE
jgi:hypothetical protein